MVACGSTDNETICVVYNALERVKCRKNISTIGFIYAESSTIRCPRSRQDRGCIDVLHDDRERFRLISSCLIFTRLDREPNHVNFALSRLGYSRRDDLSEVFDTALKS